jgi:hypothetical protein
MSCANNMTLCVDTLCLGHAKVPLSAQSWHVPLDSNGRFDWKSNEKINLPRPFYHKEAWRKIDVTRAHYDSYLPIRMLCLFEPVVTGIFGTNTFLA